MLKRMFIQVFVLSFIFTINSFAQATDYTKFGNPFIGTHDTGHTFPGATAPFGFVQPSPDTGDHGWAYTSGYQFTDKEILGFSNTHLSGVGVPDLGDILLQPFTGEAVKENYKSSFDKVSEKASAGFYGVFLKDFGVKVELTASENLKYLGLEGLIEQYSHGNEPSHHIAYLYKYTDEGWKTDALVREIATKLYSDKPDGITGNDDCGQMSGWSILSSIGLYPMNPSGGKYVLGAPQVSSAKIRLENGKNLTVKAKNLSDTNKYVKEIYFNSKHFDEISISHQKISQGGDLIFVMADKIN